MSSNKPTDAYENIRFGYLELQGSSLTQKMPILQNDQDRIPKPMPILFYHGEKTPAASCPVLVNLTTKATGCT